MLTDPNHVYSQVAYWPDKLKVGDMVSYGIIFVGGALDDCLTYISQYEKKKWKKGKLGHLVAYDLRVHTKLLNFYLSSYPSPLLKEIINKARVHTQPKKIKIKY